MIFLFSDSSHPRWSPWGLTSCILLVGHSAPYPCRGTQAQNQSRHSYQAHPRGQNDDVLTTDQSNIVLQKKAQRVKNSKSLRKHYILEFKRKSQNMRSRTKTQTRYPRSESQTRDPCSKLQIQNPRSKSQNTRSAFKTSNTKSAFSNMNLVRLALKIKTSKKLKGLNPLKIFKKIDRSQ